MPTFLHQLFAWAPLGLPAFVFVLTFVVFFHELGHFLVARAFGVAIETFSIGFGSEIVGWTDKKGTRWKISWLPFGGYVKFLGDDGAASTPDRERIAQMNAEERSVAFPFKPLWQRCLVVVAGPVANFVLAIVVFTVLFAVFGLKILPPIRDRSSPIRRRRKPGSTKGTRLRPLTANPFDFGPT